jgi:hypothetical protein
MLADVVVDRVAIGEEHEQRVDPARFELGYGLAINPRSGFPEDDVAVAGFEEEGRFRHRTSLTVGQGQRQVDRSVSSAHIPSTVDALCGLTRRRFPEVRLAMRTRLHGIKRIPIANCLPE